MIKKIIIVALFCLTCQCFVEAKTDLFAGAAKVDITPKIGIPLAGFGARQSKPSTGIKSPLFSRAVVMKSGKTKIAIVGVDTLIITKKMYQDVGKIVEKKTDIKVDNLFLGASHTHAGSGALLKEVGYILGAGAFNQKVYNEFVNRVAQSIISANKELTPARVSITSNTGEGLSYNRRIKNGPKDTEIGIIKIEDKNKNLISVVVNFSAHPTIVGGLEFSADFPGEYSKVLEKKYPGAVAIFLNGSLGDQAPGGECPDNDREKCLGKLLAEKVMEKMFDEKCEITDIKVFKQELILNSLVGITTEICAIKFISLKKESVILTIPGEAFAEVGEKIKNKGKDLGYENVFVFGLINDAIGYIVYPEEQYHKHQYETMLSLFGAKLGPFILEEGLKLLVRAKN